jgi:hypothetical protein
VNDASLVFVSHTIRVEYENSKVPFRSYAMPQFAPQLIQDMRNALEDVMTRVPMEYSTTAVKVYLAECILKAAAQGHTSYNELIVAAADQIQVAISLFS